MNKNLVKLKALKEKYKDEQVFVVPTSILSHLKDGFTKEKHSPAIYSKYDNSGKFIYRYDAEGDITFQQIIPYIILFDSSKNLFYVYQRIKGSGESRLHNQYSIGFGGHIDLCDGNTEVIFHGLIRELVEEVEYNNVGPITFIGHIRNMQSSTNDHTGLVFVLPVNYAKVKETDKYIGEWMTANQLEEHYFKFEDWGKHLINYIVENDYKIL